MARNRNGWARAIAGWTAQISCSGPSSGGSSLPSARFAGPAAGSASPGTRFTSPQWGHGTLPPACRDSTSNDRSQLSHSSTITALTSRPGGTPDAPLYTDRVFFFRGETNPKREPVFEGRRGRITRMV
jgi:hypothetical protein